MEPHYAVKCWEFELIKTFQIALWQLGVIKALQASKFSDNCVISTISCL